MPVVNLSGVFVSGVPGRSGPAAVLSPERPPRPSAHRHVVQQQPVQAPEGLLLPIAPTGILGEFVSRSCRWNQSDSGIKCTRSLFTYTSI